MTQTEMEQLLEKIDHRLARIEQFLPTVATKQDLEAFERRANDRFTIKQDLEAFERRANQRFATKQDLDALEERLTERPRPRATKA